MHDRSLINYFVGRVDVGVRKANLNRLPLTPGARALNFTGQIVRLVLV